MTDDRTAPGRGSEEHERVAPPASRTEDGSSNGRARDEDDSRAANRSSSGKPALTRREREERWPLG
jgi:hypothetical protein